MGTIECSQPTSKSSWHCQDFGDISMVLKMAHFRKSTGPRWVNDSKNTLIMTEVRQGVMRFRWSYQWRFNQNLGHLQSQWRGSVCPMCIRILHLRIQHIEAKTKWPPFHRRHFKCIFLNEKIWVLLNISLKFVPNVRINNIPALVQIMDWCRQGDKPLS